MTTKGLLGNRGIAAGDSLIRKKLAGSTAKPGSFELKKQEISPASGNTTVAEQALRSGGSELGKDDRCLAE